MITFQQSGQILHVKINNDINFETTRQMEVVLQDYEVPNEVQEVHLDFTAVKFIDSTGVSLLIKWIHPLTKYRKVCVYGASEPIKNVLRICKLEQFVEVV